MISPKIKHLVAGFRRYDVLKKTFLTDTSHIALMYNQAKKIDKSLKNCYITYQLCGLSNKLYGIKGREN